MDIVNRYHIFLIFIGQTTNEQLRGVFEVRTYDSHLPLFSDTSSILLSSTLSVIICRTNPSLLHPPDHTLPYPTLPYLLPCLSKLIYLIILPHLMRSYSFWHSIACLESYTNNDKNDHNSFLPPLTELLIRTCLINSYPYRAKDLHII